MEFMQMRGIRQHPDSMRMKGMMPGMGMRHAMMPGPGMMMRGGMGHGNGMMRGMGRGPAYGMRGMGRGPAYGMREGMRMMRTDSVRRQIPGGLPRFMLESIPNVTEKQKKAISDLMLKQQDEMKKFREETAAKMQSMRDTHRKNMTNLLTDEQKKFIESKKGNANAAPGKGK
jgi:hypothetical protein